MKAKQTIIFLLLLIVSLTSKGQEGKLIYGDWLDKNYKPFTFKPGSAFVDIGCEIDSIGFSLEGNVISFKVPYQTDARFFSKKIETIKYNIESIDSNNAILRKVIPIHNESIIFFDTVIFLTRRNQFQSNNSNLKSITIKNDFSSLNDSSSSSIKISTTGFVNFTRIAKNKIVIDTSFRLDNTLDKYLIENILDLPYNKLFGYIREPSDKNFYEIEIEQNTTITKINVRCIPSLLIPAVKLNDLIILKYKLDPNNYYE